MALKREIIIEVDDKGAIKSVDGLTDALNDNTAAAQRNENAVKNAGVSAEEFAASIEKQEARIKVLDGTVNLVGGSIETFTGALVLSGAVSEETAQKFEGMALGALALADGAKRTVDGYKTLSEGLKSYGGVAGLAQKAQAALNGTILANPYVAAAAAIAALAAAIYYFSQETDKAAEFQKELDAAMVQAEATAASSTFTLDYYNQIVQDTTRSEGERTAALEELKKQGVASEDIELSNAEALGILNQRVQENINLITKRTIAKAQEQILAKAIEDQVKIENSTLEENLTFWDKTVATAATLFSAYGTYGGTYIEVTRAAANKNEALADAQVKVQMATESYEKALSELITAEGQNVETQKTVRENLERRAKTDKAVQQALTDRANAEKEAIGIYAQAAKDLEVLRAAESEKEIVRINQNYEERLAKLKFYYGEESDAVKALEELKAGEIAAVRKKQQEEADKAAEEKKQKELEAAKELADLKTQIADAEAVTDEQKYQRQLEVTAKYYDDLIEQAKQNNLDTVELEKAKNAALQAEQDAHNAESTDKEKAYREQLVTLATDSALSLIGDLKSLNQIFDKDNEAAAEKAFKREKALAIVETIISTYLSAQKAYASQLSIPSPDAPVRAAIAAAVAVASGLAKLAVIKKQQFNSGGSTGGSTGGGGAAGGGGYSAPGGLLTPATVGTPQNGLFGPPNLANKPTPVLKTYVLAGDVTSAQEAEAKINQRRKL